MTFRDVEVELQGGGVTVPPQHQVRVALCQAYIVLAKYVSAIMSSAWFFRAKFASP